MAWHFSPGPVFQLEMTRQGRRWQTYAARVAVVAALLATLAICHAVQPAPRVVPGWPAPPTGLRALAPLATEIAANLAIVQLTLVLMLAPALAAGVLIPERNRGVLVHELATDLTGQELAFGRWLGRVVPILALVAAGAPFVFLLMLFGGVGPEQALNLLLLLVAYALLLPALCLFLSLRLRRVADLLAIVYLLLALWCALPLFGWTLGFGALRGEALSWLNAASHWSPFRMLAAGNSLAGQTLDVMLEHAAFCGAAAGLAVALVAWSGYRLRAICWQSDGPRARRRWNFKWPGGRGREPNLDERPILWLEWARRRPWNWAALLHAATLAAGAGLAAWGFIENWFEPSGRGPTPFLQLAVFALGGFLALSHLLALMAIAGHWAEDRVNRHLEMLAVTPLEPAEILRDRSAAAFGRLRGGAFGAPALLLLGLPREPLLVWVGAALLGATAYALARFVAALATWLGLRFAKPWRGLVVGAAILVALNVGIFMLGFAAAGRGRALGSGAVTLGFALAAAMLAYRFRAALNAASKRLTRHSPRAQAGLLLLAGLGSLVALANVSDPAPPAMFLMQSCPFVALLFTAICGVDRDFWNGHDFGPWQAVWALILAFGWWRLAARLDRWSLHWLPRRMREGDARG